MALFKLAEGLEVIEFVFGAILLSYETLLVFLYSIGFIMNIYKRVIF